MTPERRINTDLSRVDEHWIKREAQWLREGGQHHAADLIMQLWIQLSHARAREATTAPGQIEELVFSRPDLATPLLDHPKLSIAFLRSITSAPEDDDAVVYVPTPEAGGRSRLLTIGTLGHLRQLAHVAMERIAGSTLACDTLTQQRQEEANGGDALQPGEVRPPAAS